MSDLIAASTTDPEAAVRESIGLPPEPSEEEKREAAEMERQRAENGNNSPVAKMERRIDKLTARWREAERERDELRQRLEQYEQAQNGNHAEPSEQREMPQPAEAEQAPGSSPPETLQEHERQAAQFRERLEQNPQIKAEVHAAFKKAIEEGKELPLTLAPAVASMENGPQVLAYFFRNPEALERLRQVEQANPVDAIREMHRVSAVLSFQPATPTRSLPVSRAPAPIRPLSGHSTKQPVDLNDPNLSQAEFRRIRDAQEKEWKRGVRR